MRDPVVTIGFLFTLYYLDSLLFGGPPPSSHINHTQRLIISYKCPALAWLISSLLFLI